MMRVRNSYICANCDCYTAVVLENRHNIVSALRG